MPIYISIHVLQKIATSDNNFLVVWLYVMKAKK